MAERSKRPPLDEHADFVMSFVDHSREKRDDFEDIWAEVERNFLVRSLDGLESSRNTAAPLGSIGLGGARHNHGAILKDPETHQAVMTIVSKIVLTLMGEPGFIKAKRVGDEDILKAEVVSKVLERMLRLEGHYTTMVEWVLSAALYGTGILEMGWHFEEGPRQLRSVQVNPLTGQELVSVGTFIVPTFDDVRMRLVGARDFFNDPGETMISRMEGVAKRFRVTAMDARSRADGGVYRKKATEDSIRDRVMEDARSREDHESHDETDLDRLMESHDDFIKMVGYEYFGNVPWKEPDGIQHRVITVINGRTVRSKPWPRRKPFFDIRLTPRLNNFWGIAPAETIRYDQDFADTIKMMLADAVVRSTHPPHIYSKDGDVDINKLRVFRPDVPVGARDVNQVAQIPYSPPVQAAFSMYAGVKQQMREASSALGALQGLGLGSKRFSASEAAATFQQALDRPEMWATIAERDYLPPIGKYGLELYQEFVEDSQDLARRVGESEYPVSLASILGDFDLEFVGSRIEGGKADMLTAYREIFALGANPIAAQVMPWIPLIKEYIGERLGVPEIAAMVGNPQLVELHLRLHQVLGNGNPQSGNGANPPSNPPTGLLPAQLAGETIV